MNGYEEAEGVLIGQGSYYVRLKRLQEKDADSGMETMLIDVRAGGFHGSVKDDTLAGVSQFYDDLSVLYNTLSGTASLWSYDGFQLMFEARRGQIIIHVVVFDGSTQQSKLSFDYLIDQSFLPSILKGIKREFL